MPIKTSSAKAKGRAAQQHVRDVLRKTFPELQDGDIESRGMGQQGSDVVLSPLAQAILNIAVECKATNTEPSLAALRQCRANTPDGAIPVVAWKPRGVGHDQMVVMLDLTDFAGLLRRAAEVA